MSKILIDEALAEQPAQQSAELGEPVAWQILNGVCHAGIRSSESLAKEAASGMQKTHDLGGSLAAFHVRPLYATPQPPAQRTWVGLTDEEIIIMSRYDLEYATLIGEVQKKLKEKNT